MSANSRAGTRRRSPSLRASQCRADVQRLRPASRGAHLEIFGCQPRLEQLYIVVNVVNYEHAGDHDFVRLLSCGAYELAHDIEERGNRDRLGDVSFAAAFTDALLVALHGEGGDGDDWDRTQLIIFLQPFGYFEA
jgi:hypothetical protein